MEIRKQLVKRNIAGDVILVPIGDASLELKGLVTLNETGELLWDRLPQAADAADLAAALRAEYDVDEPTALQDAQAFLDALRQLNIVGNEPAGFGPEGSFLRGADCNTRQFVVESVEQRFGYLGRLGGSDNMDRDCLLYTSPSPRDRG